MKKDELSDFIGDNGHFGTMFDFSATVLGNGEHGWYDSKPIQFDDFRRVLYRSQLACQDVGFLANIIENHDSPRGVNRFLPEYARNDAGIKMLGTVSVLLRGIPFLYQGQEIGMQNCQRDSIEEYDDISTIQEYHKALEAGFEPKEALAVCGQISRDNARTPMQWDDGENAGFTRGTPWLKTNPNYRRINVKEQMEREDSVLNYYKRLLALRKSDLYREVFTYGRFAPLFEMEEKIFAYERRLENTAVRVIANFSCEEKTLPVDYLSGDQVLLNNLEEIRVQERSITLRPFQVVVVRS